MEQEYVNTFDTIFNAELIKTVDFNKLKLLKSIFNAFDEDLYTPSSKYRLLRKEDIRVLDAIRPSLTETQTALLDKHLDISNAMTEELEEQLFLFGCLVGYKFKDELEFQTSKSK